MARATHTAAPKAPKAVPAVQAAPIAPAPGLWARLKAAAGRVVAACGAKVRKTADTVVSTARAAARLVVRNRRDLGWGLAGAAMAAAVAAPTAVAAWILCWVATTTAGLLVLSALYRALPYYRHVREGICEVGPGVWRDLFVGAALAGVVLAGVVVPLLLWGGLALLGRFEAVSACVETA